MQLYFSTSVGISIEEISQSGIVKFLSREEVKYKLPLEMYESVSYSWENKAALEVGYNITVAMGILGKALETLGPFHCSSF